MSTLRHRPEVFGLALGFYATLTQVVLLREALTVAGGNELSLGLGLAIWLLGVGLGAIPARWFSKPLGAVLVAVGLSFPVVVAELAALRLHRVIFDLPPGGDPSLPMLTLILLIGLLPGAATVGLYFTLSARAYSTGGKTPASGVYFAEALGAVVGGLLFSFVLAGRLSHLSVLGFGVVSLAAAMAARVDGWRSVMALIAAAGLIILVFTGPLDRLDSSSAKRAFRELPAAGELVDMRDSPYGRLALGERHGQFQLFADGRLDHSFPDPWERVLLVHLALSQHPHPANVLLVGGGAPDRVQAALSHRPDRVVLTYIDKLKHTMCEPYFSADTRAALSDPRVELQVIDGRRFLSDTRDRFDAIVVFGNPPLSARENRYYTLEFFREVERALAPGGVVTLRAPGGTNVISEDAATASAGILATVGEVFGRVLVVPGPQLTIHAARDEGQISSDPVALGRRFKERVKTVFGFAPTDFGHLLDSERLKSVAARLARSPAVVNTDFKPTAYQANIRLWERGLSGSPDSPTWTGMAKRFSWVVLLVPLLFWVVSAFRAVRFKRPARVRNAIFSITTTGAVGMSVEVMILYAYQAACGVLYDGLAVLIATFMAGLAGGAALGRRFLGPGSRFNGAWADGAVLVLLAVTAPVLELAVSVHWLVAVWSVVAGVATGAAFPAFLTVVAAVKGEGEASAAGPIEAADHIGGALGALMTGLVWLPAFGVFITCLFLGVFKLLSLAGQLIRIANKEVVQAR